MSKKVIVLRDNAINGFLDSFLDRSKDQVLNSLEKAGQSYIDKNGEKIFELAYGVADKVIGDTEAGKAKVAELTQAAVQSGTKEASNSVSQMLYDNRYMIIGGVIVTLILFGSVGYGVASVAGAKARAN